jgi:FixJ family two-component response regulator
MSRQIHAHQEKQCMPRVPRVAIVDDDDALRNSLDNLLRSVGFGVQGFASAEAFLQADHAHETACLILDVRLPGMNGLELQRQLVAANWRIPIIVVTAYADDDVRARGDPLLQRRPVSAGT